MTLKAGQGLKLLGPEVSEEVLIHPAQQAAVTRIAKLIGQLRSCKTPSDFYEFQQLLFSDIYGVEERRGQCSRIIKRFRAGRSLPIDSPPRPAKGDPAKLESWLFEAFVYERLARQLRTVGDGLAWRCFGYDRRVILAFSRNSSPGMMYGKEGLPYELGRIEELWKKEGHFALLHDLTNCLRIADLTEFTNDNGVLLREIKAKPHTDKKQMARMQVAIDAVMQGGVLPGDSTDARLVELAEPYATNLSQLDDLLQLAKQHGYRGMKLPQGRALVATSLLAVHQRWGRDYEEGMRILESVRQRAIKRAGIADSVHHVKSVSADTASRSPIMPPWSIYPFTPEDCAAIICDLLIFETILSIDHLIGSIERAGLQGDMLLPPDRGELSLSEDVLRITQQDRAITLHTPGLSPLLYELVQPDIWAKGMSEVISMPDPPTEPVLVFGQEADTWYQA